MKDTPGFSPSCPTPIARHDRVTVAHGGGGRLMHELLDRVFLSVFSNPLLDPGHDAAVFSLGSPGQRLAFTTDSYVVRPLFFPGGDIGALAVNGTVNDLAMAGARPRFLSAGFIVEEGLEVAILERVVRSMQEAAALAGVHVVTGDTKVVERGKGDGLYINTAGVGTVEHDLRIAPASVQPGDVVILSGDVGRHGMAVMAAREGLGFEAPIESDCAPLAAPVLALIEAGLAVHCLRDLTRGGLATALNEIAGAAGVAITVDEQAVSVRPEVQAACELLGLDPLYVANEGRFAAFVPEAEADRAIAVLEAFDVTAQAAVAARVRAGTPGRVTVTGPLGGTRMLGLLSGEQLPRIC
ncbi:MAG TPA: hydrogenase expression/formation protein HypE [Vicinamibacterales bacterium]|nr:hydrogenase expression/formation protein HypE [Vicinamibacterales bacterium]